MCGYTVLGLSHQSASTFYLYFLITCRLLLEVEYIMDLLVAKLVSMLVLGGVSLLVGLIPFLMKKKMNLAPGTLGDKAVSCLSCFGGGVILTTSITHMLPEVNKYLRHNIEHGHIPNIGLPLAEIFVLCGFFMIYIVEEVSY